MSFYESGHEMKHHLKCAQLKYPWHLKVHLLCFPHLFLVIQKLLQALLLFLLPVLIIFHLQAALILFLLQLSLLYGALDDMDDKDLL